MGGVGPGLYRTYFIAQRGGDGDLRGGSQFDVIVSIGPYQCGIDGVAGGAGHEATGELDGAGCLSGHWCIGVLGWVDAGG